MKKLLSLLLALALIMSCAAVFAEDYFDEKEKTDVKLDFELKEDTTVALGIFEGIIYNARVE